MNKYFFYFYHFLSSSVLASKKTSLPKKVTLPTFCNKHIHSFHLYKVITLFSLNLNKKYIGYTFYSDILYLIYLFASLNALVRKKVKKNQ